MKNKLTLSIDRKLIDRAKRLARLKGKSLSQIFEDYIEKEMSEPKSKRKYAVDDLAGILKDTKAENLSYKELVREVVTEKYLKKKK